MGDSNSGQWEKKTSEEIKADKYRFTGERYGFRGTAGSLPSDWIPQIKGLYAFPAQDAQNVDTNHGFEDT